MLQYIHLNAVKNTLVVIVTLARLDRSWFTYSRPAALSTDNPKRNLQGGWKTPLCRLIESGALPYDGFRVPNESHHGGR